MYDVPRLRRILARQDGVITSVQARSVGMSPSTISRMIAKGEWERLGARVLHAVDHELTPSARIRAATWSAGPSGALCGESAAYWSGLSSRVPSETTVNVPRGHRRVRVDVRRLGPVRVWNRDLREIDVCEVRGLRITGPSLTVMDAGVTLGLTMVGQALFARKVTYQSLKAVHDRYPGRRGATAGAEILDLVAAGLRSEGERLFRDLVASAGLPEFEANVFVDGFPVDALFRDQRVAVEIDGYEYHATTQDQHDRDTLRDNVLKGAGWDVRRFTYRDLIDRPKYVLDTLRRALGLH